MKGLITGDVIQPPGADELLKEKESGSGSVSSEEDILKLGHELSEYKVELEIQNSDLLQAREQLEKNIEIYAELYDFAPTGFLTISGDGKILGLNLSAATMLGKNRNLIVNSQLGIYLTEESRTAFSGFLHELFGRGERQSCEVVISNLYKPDLHAILVGHLSADGRNGDLSMIDISDRKQAEEKVLAVLNELKTAYNQLEQSHQLNSDKDLFISTLAHDLRNPFSVLLGYTELLSEKFRESQSHEMQALLNELNRATHTTYNLLEDLLKWSRIRTGKIPFEPVKLNIRDVCYEIMDSLSPIAEGKKIRLECVCMEEISVIADDGMLKAILRNLVSNAIKFTFSKGVVRIKAQRLDSTLVISVSDDGIGIEAPRLNKLFDIAHNHSTPGTAGEKGTGLGLLLIKDFVNKHGGRLWVESTEGKGSAFYFSLPVRSDYNGGNLNRHTLNIPVVDNLKILIADDEAPVRMILGTMIQKYSREIIYADSGAVAVQQYRENPDTDLILIDFNMPDMNGLEACRQIRLLNEQVVIIAESAESLHEISDDAADIRINDFLPKPYSGFILEELIRKHFSKKGMPEDP